VLPLLDAPHHDEVADVLVSLEVLDQVRNVVRAVGFDQQRGLGNEDVGCRQRVDVDRRPRDIEQLGEAPADALVRLEEGDDIVAAGDGAVFAGGEWRLGAGEWICAFREFGQRSSETGAPACAGRFP
jgi:hypothetical protein